MQGDAHFLACHAGSFGVILALGVFPWLHAPEAAAAEIARVLEPNGVLIASADNRWRITQMLDPKLSPILASARQLARQLRGASRRLPDEPPQAHSRREFDALLTTAGLHPIAHGTCGFGPFTWLGEPLAGGTIGVGLDRYLQRRADAGCSALRMAGQHILTVCSKS
jgi:SAM-dependent methyltransferase